MKNPAVAGLFCAFSLLTCAAAAQETTPAMSAVETAPAAAVNSELEAALGTVSAAEAAEAAQQQAQPAATAPAASSVDALSSNAVPTSSSEESGQTSETPLAVNSAASEELSGEPQEYSMRMAFLLPAADSPLESPSQTALLGLLAANYASEHPAEVLLVRPGSNGSAVDQLKAAARAGAQVAVGPLDRAAISEIAKLNYLPLPLVALNGIELNVTPHSVTLVPVDTPEMSFETEAEFLGVQPRAVLVLNKYILLRMLQQRYTKFRAHSDGRMPVVAEGGAGCYVAMPIHLSPKFNPQTNQEANKMETNEIKETDSRRESANETPDPMEELNHGIDELRGKLKLLLDETGVLTRKVKEAVLKQKQKERDFILAKRAIERIKMAI